MLIRKKIPCLAIVPQVMPHQKSQIFFVLFVLIIMSMANNCNIKMEYFVFK